MEFHEEVINGRPTAKWFSQMAELHGKQIMREYERSIKEADLRLATDNWLPVCPIDHSPSLIERSGCAPAGRPAPQSTDVEKRGHSACQ
jgi:hypothetical protein